LETIHGVVIVVTRTQVDARIEEIFASVRSGTFEQRIDEKKDVENYLRHAGYDPYVSNRIIPLKKEEVSKKITLPLITDGSQRHKEDLQVNKVKVIETYVDGVNNTTYRTLTPIGRVVNFRMEVLPTGHYQKSIVNGFFMATMHVWFDEWLAKSNIFYKKPYDAYVSAMEEALGRVLGTVEKLIVQNLEREGKLMGLYNNPHIIENIQTKFLSIKCILKIWEIES
jgi:hypothetical protein